MFSGGGRGGGKVVLTREYTLQFSFAVCLDGRDIFGDNIIPVHLFTIQYFV